MSDKAELQRIARLVDVNRQRLEQIEEQLAQLETIKREHRETELSLESMQDSTPTMVPLGSGVHLPTDKAEKVVVDLGSNVFGERSLVSAAGIMKSRQEDLQSVIDDLLEQKQSTEQRIRELAQTFEARAKEVAPQKIEEITGTESPVSEIMEEEKKPTRRRRRGFGGELTLDD